MSVGEQRTYSGWSSVEKNEQKVWDFDIKARGEQTVKNPERHTHIWSIWQKCQDSSIGKGMYFQQML